MVGHNYRNSYEQTVNSFGDIYQSDNDDNLPVIAPREGLIYGPEGTQPKVSPDPLEPYGLTAESYQCDLSQKAPRLKGVSDYFFRFVLDFSSVNGNKEKSLRLEPTPTSVLAWDPNHGSIDANKEPHALWIALRADDSVFTVPRSQVKESYFVNGHWTFTKPAGLNSSVFVPTEWVFPNETWPPNAEPYLP